MSKSIVLHATDFSADSELAMKQARAVARMSDATLMLVHVLHRPTTREGEGMLHEGAYPDPSGALTQQLRDLAATVTDVPCDYQLLRGEPAAAILKYASDVSAAMIVMGTHGRSGVARILMGSVAEQVIREAPCPVMVVRRPKPRS